MVALKETASWKKFAVGKSDSDLEIVEQIVVSIMPNKKTDAVRVLIDDLKKEGIGITGKEETIINKEYKRLEELYEIAVKQEDVRTALEIMEMLRGVAINDRR